MNKIKVSPEELRFLWHLGFTSGRVRQYSETDKGCTWDEEGAYWTDDIARLIRNYPQMGRKISDAELRVHLTEGGRLSSIHEAWRNGIALLYKKWGPKPPIGR